MMKRNLLAIVIIIGLIGYAIYDIKGQEKDKKTATQKSENTEQVEETTASEVTSSGKSGINEGDFAPDFTLQTLEGKNIKLSDYKGKKVVLNLWASWCPPCKAEMPHMQAFYEKNKDKQNVEILAVNLTTMEKDRANIQTFVDDYQLTFPVPLDEKGDIGVEYQAFSIPTTYMIDSNGTIQRKIVGPMDEEFLNKMVSSMK
ncbi:peroxiredoxin family protein [Fictibacillus aquaticus]